MDLHSLLFWSIAALTGVCAVAVVVTQNIVRAATWLLFTLGGTSGIFFLLGADLVGAIQLLIYVGGTLVLVVFGVMLTAQGPFISMKTGAAEWAVSGVVGLVLLAVLVVTVFSVSRETQTTPDGERLLRPPKDSVVAKYAPQKRLSDDPATAGYSAVIGSGFLGAGVGPAHEDGKKRVRMSYLLPFEIISVHLLVVLIGAAYLARAKRRRVIAAVPTPGNGVAP